MSENEQSATFEAAIPKDQKFELVGEYPGQVKFSGPPRQRPFRPRRGKVEQLALPDLLPSADENQK